MIAELTALSAALATAVTALIAAWMKAKTDNQNLRKSEIERMDQRITSLSDQVNILEKRIDEERDRRHAIEDIASRLHRALERAISVIDRLLSIHREHHIPDDDLIKVQVKQLRQINSTLDADQ